MELTPASLHWTGVGDRSCMHAVAGLRYGHYLTLPPPARSHRRRFRKVPSAASHRLPPLKCLRALERERDLRWFVDGSLRCRVVLVVPSASVVRCCSCRRRRRRRTSLLLLRIAVSAASMIGASGAVDRSTADHVPGPRGDPEGRHPSERRRGRGGVRIKVRSGRSRS
jgi:hypothetical protein